MLTILLDQEAIEEALTDYISGTAMGVDLDNKDVNIKLTAGRSGNGHKAEVSVTPRESTGNDPEENDVDTPTASDEPEDEPAIGPFD